MLKESLRIIHCADFHIDSPFKFLNEQKRLQANKAQLESFRETIKIAKKFEAHFITIAGDLFDSIKPNETDIRIVVQAIQKAPEIKFIINPGNSDYWHINSFWLEISKQKNVYLFDLETLFFTFPEWNLTFWGKPFLSQSSLTNLWQDADELIFSKKRNQMNILVQHSDLFDLDSYYNPISPEWIDKLGFDLVLLGHIHNVNEIYYTKREIPCLYSGCAQASSFDETGAKGVYFVEIKKNDLNDIKFNFVPIQAMLFEEIIVDVSQIDTSSKTDFLDQIERTIIKAKDSNQANLEFYRIILVGNSLKKIDLAFLQQNLDLDCFYFEIIDHTRVKFDLQYLVKEQSLHGDISLYAKKLATQPDLLSDVLKKLELEDLPMQEAMEMLDQAYYYTILAKERDIDIYED